MAGTGRRRLVGLLALATFVLLAALLARLASFDFQVVYQEEFRPTGGAVGSDRLVCGITAPRVPGPGAERPRLTIVASRIPLRVDFLRNRLRLPGGELVYPRGADLIVVRADGSLAVTRPASASDPASRARWNEILGRLLEAAVQREAPAPGPEPTAPPLTFAEIRRRLVAVDPGLEAFWEL